MTDLAVEPTTEPSPLDKVDAALTEFSTRDTVPAPALIDFISEIDPVAAAQLCSVKSTYDGVSVLFYRDAINILLDLRNSLS